MFNSSVNSKVFKSAFKTLENLHRSSKHPNISTLIAIKLIGIRSRTLVRTIESIPPIGFIQGDFIKSSSDPLASKHFGALQQNALFYQKFSVQHYSKFFESLQRMEGQSIMLEKCKCGLQEPDDYLPVRLLNSLFEVRTVRVDLLLPKQFPDDRLALFRCALSDKFLAVTYGKLVNAFTCKCPRCVLELLNEYTVSSTNLIDPCKLFNTRESSSVKNCSVHPIQLDGLSLSLIQSRKSRSLGICNFLQKVCSL